jgi:hypothetical protein
VRNPRFKEIKPNYRKRALDIILQEGRKAVHYSLPFAVFRGYHIGPKNRFSKISIDPELAGQGAVFEIEDGSKGDFPADFVLYYCDPSYDWSPLNQLKKALKEHLRASSISIRVLADSLHTSPSQVVRLLEQNRGPSKQLRQLFQLAELVGYQVEFNLRKKSAA